jgi:hypothetical protein
MVYLPTEYVRDNMSRIVHINPEKPRHRRLKERLADAISGGITEYPVRGGRIDVVGDHLAAEIEMHPSYASLKSCARKLKGIRRPYRWLVIPSEKEYMTYEMPLDPVIVVRTVKEIDSLLKSHGW